MTVKPFLDTNVVVYATLEDSNPNAAVHAERALSMLVQGGVVSVQVAQELVDVARRKFKRSWPEISEILSLVEELCGPALPMTAELQRRAVALAAQYNFRIYDAAIIASALEAGCSVLYTEDLQHGQNIEGLRIENPFLG